MTILERILRYSQQSGRKLKENGLAVNLADMIEAIYNGLVVNKDAGLQLTGSNAQQATATIANGSALSGIVDLIEKTLIGISMPAAWTAAGVTFDVSNDGVNFGALYYNGSEFTITEAVAGIRITVDPVALLPWRYIKVRSGTAATPVNQAAERAITLWTKPV